MEIQIFKTLSTLITGANARAEDRGVKDWSHLIPGQDGFVDQLDIVVFAAPIFYHLTRYFWVI
jgi:predicted CDP-diglyceride synthetase/phosphatidate cytidylyltransferase